MSSMLVAIDGHPRNTDRVRYAFHHHRYSCRHFSHVGIIETVAHAWTDRQKSVKFHNKIDTNNVLQS